MRFFVATFGPLGASAHGVIYEPPARTASGLNLLIPTCAGGSCLWFNQGSTIGCPEATGNSGTPLDPPDCKNHAEPTIKFADKKLRTYALSMGYRLDDYTKYHPWRYPGSSPIVDPCGLAGGWYTTGAIFAGGDAPPGVPQGAAGSKFPFNQKIFAQTEWIAGSTAEVAWGITANHGGGYSYRLCPFEQYEKDGEACFQKHPLLFVGDTQWIQWGHGMDINNRTEIPATTVSGDKVIPVGSTWRKNPIPPCNTPISGGAISHTRCKKPTFEPAIPDLFGFGPGACGSNIPGAYCNAEQFAKQNFDFGIVDKVYVPDLPEGEYVVSFRWDSEQTNQVWNSCGDVTIKKSGAGTQPFSMTKSSCELCCEELQLPCSNCTKCLNDKTGDCAYCWNPLPGYDPSYAPPTVCLGFEAEDGTAPDWWLGDPMLKGWSPGCPRCWSDDSLCKPHARPEKKVELSV
jgi:hypothetical protein